MLEHAREQKRRELHQEKEKLEERLAKIRAQEKRQKEQFKTVAHSFKKRVN